MTESRLVPPPGRVFTAHAEAELTHITEVEGRPLGSPVALRLLAATPGMVFVETRFAAGQGSKPHAHADHDSIVYVVSGRMTVVIGDQSWEAGPGDAFHHAPGVVHHMEALEDAVTVEVKNPPVRTW